MWLGRGLLRGGLGGGDTAPARQDQSPTRSPGRGGRAGAYLSSQWGGVWTAGRWGCRGPESRVAGGQLLTATPAHRAGAPGSILVMLALSTGQGQTRVQVSEEQSAAGAARGAGLEKQLLDRVSGAQVYTAHTHAQACAHAHTAWPRGKGGGSPICTQTSHTLWAPCLGWGRGAHQEDCWVPQLGMGFPWESRLSVDPPPAWDSWLNVGGRRPQFSCEAGRGESSSGEAGPMDGRRAGQSHLCSAS